MALRRRPHKVTFIPVNATYTGGRVDVPEEGTARTIMCQVTPLTAEQVVRTFGGDVDLKRPQLMLCNKADGESAKVGDRVVWQSKNYFVMAPPMVWQAGQTTDCVQILLEREHE